MLATGGMAEILLGRLTGPRGFEHPVVIKRILPHLARDKSFVGMFLDEAHIAAGVRHPNVVHVHELGQEDDELFLVMEYLEGEPVASLQRRAAARGIHLDAELCAYIVAEACAGLHAAHELTNPDGSPRNIVHRDVSPQNIFVTYDGQVKVLDFGIAKAADRITRTEAGLLKGKFNYMSPEQCRGEPLDRRADAFSLGIVLYELVTGCWLFRRATQAATIRAVLEHPIVPPSELAPGLPPELDAVCMRALNRSRRRRYQSAAEMRRDLLGCVRPHAGGALPEERLAELMQRMFSDRIDEKNEMLRRLKSGERPSVFPPTIADAEVEVPEVQSEIAGTGTAHSGIAMAKRKRARAMLIGAAAVVAVGIVAAGAWVGATQGWGGDAVPPSAARPPENGVPMLARAPGARTTGGGAEQPADVTIRIESTPAGAAVEVGGEEVGETPIELQMPRGTEPVRVRLEHAGYAPLEELVVPDLDQRLRLSLTEDERPRAARPARPVKRRAAPAQQPQKRGGTSGFGLWN